MNRYFLIVLILFSYPGFAQQSKLIWKTELQDDVKKIHPIQDGKYIFLWADEYAWLYENSTGKKKWSIEIDEYNETAVHQLVYDSLYLVANEDTLLCYNILNDTLLWKQFYKGIEQDRFSGIKLTDTLLVLSFKTTDLGINAMNGKELWRLPLEYQQSLIENGTVNSIMVEKKRKYIAFLDNDECALISSSEGKKLLIIPTSEPNSDLIKQKRPWYVLSDDQKYLSIMLDKNFLVIDVDSNKILVQRPISISDQYNVLMKTITGCAVVGEEKVLHVNYSNGKIVEIQIDIDDVRNIVVTQTDSGAVMIISEENKLSGMNLDNGKLLWQTVPKFPPLKGFIDRFVSEDTNNIVVTYLDPSDDLKLYLMSINALTGTINYRTFVAHADESLPKRTLPLPSVSSVSNSISFGFENIGFDYNVSKSDSIVKFFIRTSSEMIEPNTEKAGGEGVVLVNKESGQITAKQYMKIADGISFNGGLASIAKPMVYGNILVVPGNKNLIALDAASVSLKWMLIEHDLNESYVFDMAMIDTVLYVRTGGFSQEFSYDEKKEKLNDKKLWEEDTYSLMAIDTSDGKIHWKKEFESDPGRIFHDYSILNYSYDSGRFFYGDEKFLYSLSLSLSPVHKGSIKWKFEFSDSGIGNMNYDDLFGLSTHWSGERYLHADSSRFKTDEMNPIKYSVAVNETLNISVSKIIHINYSRTKDKLIVFGEDGIASVNTATGKRDWYYEWDFSAKAVHYRPMVLKNNIFYFIDGNASLLNLNTGKIVWTSKLDKENALFIMPDRSSIIAIEKDVVTGFVIP